MLHYAIAIAMQMHVKTKGDDMKRDRRKYNLKWLVTVFTLTAVLLIFSILWAGNVSASPDSDGEIPLQEPLAIQMPLAIGVKQQDDVSTSTADHTKFEILQQEFATGPDVTAACLTCHTEAAAQVMETPHWTWEYTDPQTGEALGKNNVINNFCQSIESNEPRCTSCHAGYGYADNTFDFTIEENVDCLVCHDTTGKYKKIPIGAGHPVYGNEAVEYPSGSGNMWEPVDLSLVAQNVGATSRATCGACHFEGGGGDGVKHGDLDSSLMFPGHELDVHMDVDGLNFTCSTCHAPQAHVIPGSRYQLDAKNTDGLAIAGMGDAPLSCESCHGLEPHHGDSNLDNHVDTVACQTCHIPTFARGGVPTKTWWDWSTAGQMDENGKPFVTEDENGWHDYMSKKGDFVWEVNVQPEYAWFNGDIDYQGMRPFASSTTLLEVNSIHGGSDDPESRIWPFKIMRGKQPYDSVNNTLVTPHVYGNDDTSYWKNFDWEKAIVTGMEYSGHDYSGEYDFIETEMYWPIAHMVAPAEDALECESCHTREQGILKDIEGLHIPGLTEMTILDTLGRLLILLTLAGVMIHGLARFISNKNSKKEGLS